MKKILMLIALLIPMQMLAQKEADTENVTISQKAYENLLEQKNKVKDLQGQIDYLSKENTSLNRQIIDFEKKVNNNSDLQKKYNKALEAIDSLREEIKDARDYPDKCDKSLLIMASNFIYIPYEDYSINKIAIPAFESVQNESLKDKYNDRLLMLKSYQTDVKELATFLGNCKNVTTALMGGTKLRDLKGLAVYKRYEQYTDKTAYLCKIIARIITALDKPSQAELNSIRQELQRCLDTVTQ